MRRTISRLSVSVAAMVVCTLVALAPSATCTEPTDAAAAIRFKAHLEEKADGTDRFEEKTVDLFECFFQAHGWTSEVHLAMQN